MPKAAIVPKRVEMKAATKAIKTDILFTNRDFGSVFRVKGFIPEDNKWYELNAAQNTTEIKEAASGQEIVIVIGEQLNKEKIKNLFGGNNNA